MTAQHRARPTPVGDLTVDHPNWVAAAGVAAVAAVMLLVTLIATTMGTTTPTTPTKYTTTTTPAPTDRLTTPAVRGYFADLFTDAAIGPDSLTPEQALFLGDAVCTAHQQGTGLYSVATRIQQLTGRKLDSMQTKRLVDAADRNLCQTH